MCLLLGPSLSQAGNLLVEGLGVGGSASDVGVAGGLVGAGGELELCRNTIYSVRRVHEPR